jgi:hypothetical protein
LSSGGILQEPIQHLRILASHRLLFGHIWDDASEPLLALADPQPDFLPSFIRRLPQLLDGSRGVLERRLHMLVLYRKVVLENVLRLFHSDTARRREIVLRLGPAR